MQRPVSAGPLAGLRVLELSQIMSGPTCGLLLADLGAEVIKIEKLPGGDDSRGYRDPQVNGVSAPFMMLNRHKRGLALNPHAANGLMEYAHGLQMLHGESHHARATSLFEQAAACVPVDAREHLEVALARASLAD